ncbi:response regulator transcription factor [Bordetella holmesii]|uniref:Sigma-70, region 4 n=2 Tax=Bordetella holmesii TaxID=35814 RepID=A0A158M8U6_9BORD|nr:response regulator transcription factor [Bordetella holmesii]AHV92226.1 bacterial regulatory s, luxR family protein [Bordetella holmesii ATCC 51541]AIT25857.1 bacterial regulatory s, luxR family protein [Bordetella holmesii 44057]EWM41764.1 bacterial regulatory s, luxR family protein [Bordetella holmesii 41130]EWM46425.1 bacterial regulatory s, luxR family protein [Bordetella holmesii 35009]EWM50590.1 bacterial regulatory s, luxR family protein [Bordetella holmesii 70147]
MSPTRILLIDDHALVRDGLKLHLESHPAFLVVGEADHAQAALDLLARCRSEDLPDLVLLDLYMHDNVEYMLQAVRAGARGYLLKDEPAEEIITAIEAVMAGRNYFSARVSMKLAQSCAPASLLTQREREILRHIGAGQANKQIAQALNLSVRTVETHRQNLKRKLGIEGQAELIRYAIEHRVI